MFKKITLEESGNLLKLMGGCDSIIFTVIIAKIKQKLCS